MQSYHAWLQQHAHLHAQVENEHSIFNLTSLFAGILLLLNYYTAYPGFVLVCLLAPKPVLFDGGKNYKYHFNG